MPVIQMSERDLTRPVSSWALLADGGPVTLPKTTGTTKVAIEAPAHAASTH